MKILCSGRSVEKVSNFQHVVHTSKLEYKDSPPPHKIKTIYSIESDDVFNGEVIRGVI